MAKVESALDQNCVDAGMNDGREGGSGEREVEKSGGGW